MFFGHYRYRLTRAGDALQISEKYIVVCNDVIPRQMDIFNV
jgi:benzoate/toluate 1,2-dioxygenase beta subunit